MNGGESKQKNKNHTSGACHLKQKGIQSMKSRTLNQSTGVSACLGLALAAAVCTAGLPVQAQLPGKATIITVKTRGAGTGAGQGTWVNAINSIGEVAGWYVDRNNVYHGFIRRLHGKCTDVDARQAGNAASQGTLILGMNSAGATTGYYVDANNVNHGFVRAADGRFTIIDVPIAGTAASQGTIACNVNAAGTVLGVFIDAENNWHYFLRRSNARFTTFDVPDEGAGVSAIGWGYPDELNDAGAATSMYVDGNYVYHGWLRTPDGKVTRIDVPGAGTGPWEGTFTVAINSEGAIAGGFIRPSGNWGSVQGFVSDVHGGVTTIGPPPGMGTVESIDINARGEIVGTCWTWNEDDQSIGEDADAAFSRAPKGAYTVFRLPGAGTGNYQGTFGIAVNAQGWITGTVTDDNFVTWSYVMIP